MEKMGQPEITVYSKENCVQCNATYRALGKMALEYTVVMLEDMPEKVEEFRNEGLMQAPIVEVDGERWSGFRPNKIMEMENEGSKTTTQEGKAI